MLNLKFISYFLCLISLQISCHKHIYNPLNTINMNQDYLKKCITEKLNLYRQDADIIILLHNSFDDNKNILESLNLIDNEDDTNANYIVVSKKNFNDNHDINLRNSIVISTSLPVLDAKLNKLYLTAKVSTYYASNLTGMEVYTIVFDTDKNGNALRYLSHSKQLKHINVGAPIYLPDLSEVDSLSLKNKMMKIDSLMKHNLNSIPDSTKAKIGIN